MPRLRVATKNRPVLIKVTAVGLVLGLHLAVVGAILASPAVKPEIEQADAADMRFVEIAPEPVEAAASPVPVEQPTPEPEKEPEPVAQTPPEPVVEPAPPEVEKPPVVEQPAEEQAKPEPKPKPKPKPKPRPKSEPPKTLPVSRPAPADSPSKAVADAAPEGPAKPVDPDRPRLIGRVDYLGQRPRPIYPRVSERRGEQGRVVVRVVISPQGLVSKVSVRTSSGYSRLDEAALDAARSARFKPYTENGIAYSAMADIPFDFVL
ncbi:energy transducer TonB [Paralcaligenes sp. KSB-10]|uniref:energy transducer TonB n=1 Tax=Paralcaligenes sp. KSB-10 TaxID=2901142 RepID=UPI001E2F0FB9|nr:energy transducer TonB [Paralcaligenes sp. KSB-10]UHL64462.1 energy transducer TonB [Paralcaligenes sp. KSB-10]